MFPPVIPRSDPDPQTDAVRERLGLPEGVLLCTVHGEEGGRIWFGHGPRKVGGLAAGVGMLVVALGFVALGAYVWLGAGLSVGKALCFSFLPALMALLVGLTGVHTTGQAISGNLATHVLDRDRGELEVLDWKGRPKATHPLNELYVWPTSQRVKENTSRPLIKIVRPHPGQWGGGPRVDLPLCAGSGEDPSQAVEAVRALGPWRDVLDRPESLTPPS